jgi:hypothetical protein
MSSLVRHGVTRKPIQHDCLANVRSTVVSIALDNVRSTVVSIALDTSISSFNVSTNLNTHLLFCGGKRLQRFQARAGKASFPNVKLRSHFSSHFSISSPRFIPTGFIAPCSFRRSSSRPPSSSFPLLRSIVYPTHMWTRVENCLSSSLMIQSQTRTNFQKFSRGSM